MKKQLVIIGIITLLVCVGLSGCNEQKTTEKKNNNKNLSQENGTSGVKYPAPNITLITPASDVKDYGVYNIQSTFNVGDIVFIYYEYCNVCNVNQNKIFDTYHTINVTNKDTRVNYYTNNDTGEELEECTNWCKWWYFNTSAFPPGMYQVDIGITDRTTGLTGTKTTYFTIL
jgi:hypothetical protein